MTDAPALQRAESLFPADWLTLWKTVCFDLPLALTGGAGSLADEPHEPSPTARDRNRSQAPNRPVDVDGNALDRSRNDFASEFLEELEGCFA
jgi:hypothetical protein